MSIQQEILTDFKAESKALIEQMVEILESLEDNPNQVEKLQNYGNIVDRIMGGAKSIALEFESTHNIHKVGDYAALCKAVGYKASSAKSNVQMLEICIALLQDATEVLEKMIDGLSEKNEMVVDRLISKTFLDRLSWVSAQFKGDVKATVSSKDVNAVGDIDELMKKFGMK